MHDSHTVTARATRPRRTSRHPLRERRASGASRAGLLVGVALALVPFAGSQAAGEVSSLRVEERPGSPFRYTTNGTEYTWGIGRDERLTGFTSDGRSFGYTLSADRVELRGDDVAITPGDERCRLFAERTGADSTALSPSYPGDGSGSGACDTAAMLESRVVNRGALDLFANGATPANDVERVDYLFDSGILAPVTPEGLDRAGHVVAEKGGNNRLKIAAVLSLDAFGQPASYGPVVLVREKGCIDPALCYGITDRQHDYAFFGEDGIGPDGYPLEGERSTESVTMAFVSSERLGLEAGQRYFGFSLFDEDVDTDDHDLLDPSTFPNDTEDRRRGIPGDSADVYGGMSGWFIDESLSNGSGRVFLDENGDGLPDADEAGIADIQIQLYRDTDGNGLFDPRFDEPVCNATDTDRSGLFVLPGLPDGNYFAVLRENDPELPAGLSLGPEENPLPFAIGGNDVETLHFAFSGNGGGAGGGTDAGGSDAGGTDAGGTDAGGADAGGTDAGGTDAGGADAGGTDAGGTDGGGTDAGGTDAGGSDAGGTDAGGADAGGTDAGGTDAGGTDAGGSDAGGTDAGGTDAGGTDAGGTDAGGTDAGGTDAGGTDAGGTDGGPTEPDPGASLDDTVTRAERDRFTVRQDTPTRLDVLANDNDASGLGLTIIDFGDPPNGTAEIVPGENGGRQQILYTPTVDFFGDDSFVYQIRDGDGFETSGTVTVEVLRFSDINGNGLDDFAECECTDLTLETGVHGSGIGRPSLLLLGLLAGGAWYRRRRTAPGERAVGARVTGCGR